MAPAGSAGGPSVERTPRPTHSSLRFIRATACCMGWPWRMPCTAGSANRGRNRCSWTSWRPQKSKRVTNDTGQVCRASLLPTRRRQILRTTTARQEGGETMSKEVLEQVILKASSDARFRAQLNDNFEAATRPYDLSPEEKSELKKGMAGELADDRTARQTMAASQSPRGAHSVG